MPVPNAPEYHDSVGNLAIGVHNTASNIPDRQIWVGPRFPDFLYCPKQLPCGEWPRIKVRNSASPRKKLALSE